MPSWKVPAHLADFTIRKQGEFDMACGLYCILSAAFHFKTRWSQKLKGESYALHQALSRLRGDWNRARYSTELLGGLGLPTRRLDKLCAQVGVKLDAAPRSTYEQLVEPYDSERELWLALLPAVPFPHSRSSKTEEWSHYVLVLEANEHGLIIADPHPWRGDIYPMARAEFEACWSKTVPKTPKRWLGRLTAA
jgi:hypothetical protein